MLQCRTSKKAASLEASLASAEAQIGALEARVGELTFQNASLSASLSTARAERNALNAAVRSAIAQVLSHAVAAHCPSLIVAIMSLR